MNKTDNLRARHMYNARDTHGFCSGEELADWFAERLGDPAPAGSVRVPGIEAMKFVASCVYAMTKNSPATAIEMVNEMREDPDIHARIFKAAASVRQSK